MTAPEKQERQRPKEGGRYIRKPDGSLERLPATAKTAMPSVEANSQGTNDEEPSSSSVVRSAHAAARDAVGQKEK